MFFRFYFNLCKSCRFYCKIIFIWSGTVSPSPGLFSHLPHEVAEQEVFVRFGRRAVCLFTAYLFYGAFALAQVDGLQSFPASSTVSVPRLIRTNGSLRRIAREACGER